MEGIYKDRLDLKEEKLLLLDALKDQVSEANVPLKMTMFLTFPT
jgi:hypothetical protein